MGHEGAGAVLHAGVGGEGEGGDLAAGLGGQGADLADEGVAVLVGHADVGDKHVRAVLLQQRQRLLDARGREHDDLAALEHGGEQLADVGLVVDDEHAQALDLDRAGQLVGAGGLDLGDVGLDAQARSAGGR